MSKGKERVTSTLTLNYRSQWKLWEAIREIVQNTLDELEKLPSVEGIKRGIVIKDSGRGMTKRQFLLLGISEKDGDNKRGQYGEGLKIALVILKRMGYKVTVKSQDWMCEVVLDEIEGEPVIAYDFEQLESPIRGVEFTIKGIDQHLVRKMMKNRFLPDNIDTIVNNPRWGKIITGDYVGKLYSRGIYVQDIEKKSIYGYDLFQVTLGTDRQFPSGWSMNTNIGVLLGKIENKNEIERVIRAFQRDTVEANANSYNLNSKYLEVFEEMFGVGAVIGTDADLRGKVSYNGGKLVVVKSQPVVNAFERLGIENVIDYLTRRSEERQERQKKTFEELPVKKQKIVKQACGLIEQLNYFDNTYDTLVNKGVLEFYSSSGETLGYSNCGNIGIRIDQLHSLELTTSTLIHELIHHEFDARDLSDEFQACMGKTNKKLIKVMMRYASTKYLEKVADDSVIEAENKRKEVIESQEAERKRYNKIRDDPHKGLSDLFG